MLLLPQPHERSKKGRKQAVNKTTVCITEEDILCNLKQKEADRLDKEAQKEKQKKDREIKQHERIMEKEEKRKMKQAKKKARNETKSKEGTRKKNQPKALVAEFDQLCIDVHSSESELTAHLSKLWPCI